MHRCTVLLKDRVQLLQCRTLNFLSPERRPNNGPELNSWLWDLQSHIAAWAWTARNKAEYRYIKPATGWSRWLNVQHWVKGCYFSLSSFRQRWQWQSPAVARQTLPKCVTVPNFAVIGQTVAEIWRVGGGCGVRLVVDRRPLSASSACGRCYYVSEFVLFR